MPYKKLLIVSFILITLMSAQCSMKCGYSQGYEHEHSFGSPYPWDE